MPPLLLLLLTRRHPSSGYNEESVYGIIMSKRLRSTTRLKGIEWLEARQGPELDASVRRGREEEGSPVDHQSVYFGLVRTLDHLRKSRTQM